MKRNVILATKTKRILGILLVFGLILLVSGCKKSIPNIQDGLDAKNQTGEEDIMKENHVLPFDKLEQTGSYIKDIHMDKSAYLPEEKPELTIELKNNKEAITGIIKVLVKHLDKKVWETGTELTLSAQEEKEVRISLQVPPTDYIGYGVEVHIYEGQEETLVDYNMTAVDVSSDWNVFPRYGYVTNMVKRTEEESREVLDRLRKHHITGLFYYDVIDRHDKPLAGNPEQPEEEWNTLAWHKANSQTVKDMIQIGHEYNMKSFIYNLIFGAYDSFAQMGVKEEWGIFKDKNHAEQDVHDLSGLNWETAKLWLFDPANKGWQDYYLQIHKELFEVYPYDGIQVDSLGPRGQVYDYDGNEVPLNKNYGSLLNRLNEEIETRVIFNPVSGFGMREQLEEVNFDMVYMEVWPWDHKTYDSLKTALDTIYRTTKGTKGSVIAAYMNNGKGKTSGGSFNTAGIHFTNATLIAAGGAHLELGDTGMLSHEYYPGKTLRINETLEKELRNYYSFMVAYQNLLRGEGLEEVVTKTYVDDKLASFMSQEGRVWNFTKIKQGEGIGNQQPIEISHLINLSDAVHNEWVDDMGTQKEPAPLVDKIIKHYVTIKPNSVHVATPDFHEGIMEEVEFELGEDEDGTYVSFQLPYLKYWTMIVIQ